MSNSTVSVSYLYNLKIKLTDSNDNKLDLSSDIDNKLSNIFIMITPYTKTINTVDKETFETIEDYELLIPDEYKDYNNYCISKDFDSFEKILTEIKTIFDYKFYANTINFIFYLNYTYSLNCNIYDDFLLYLFKKFNGNFSFYGNTSSKLYLPNAELSITSLHVERFDIITDNITTFHLNKVDLKNCKINGAGKLFKETDQLVFYTNDTSSFDFINIDSAIKIGITCNVTSRYKWQNAELNLRNIFINFATNNERHKKFDHIFKLSDYNHLNCYNVTITDKMSRLIPFKIERCGNVKFINYKNLFRDPEKKGNEISLKNCDIMEFLNMEIYSQYKNESRSTAIHIDSVEDLGDVFIYNCNFTNIDLLSVSNSSLGTVSINDSIINTNQYVFNIDGNNFINELSLNNIKIYSTNFELIDKYSIFLNKCFIDNTNEINISSFKIFISDTEINSKNNINFAIKGNELEENSGSLSLKDTVITTPKNIIFKDERTESKLTLDNTKLIINKIEDYDFKKVYYKNSRFELKEGLFSSKEYSFTSHEINNNKVTDTEKSLIFNGLVSGSLTFEYESNTRLGVQFNRTALIDNERDLLKISFYSKEGNTLQSNFYINNYNLSLLLNSIDKNNGQVNINFHIADSDNKYLTTGNSIFRDNKSNNITTFLKDMTADKMNYVIINDGTMDIEKEKFNFGIKPS